MCSKLLECIPSSTGGSKTFCLFEIICWNNNKCPPQVAHLVLLYHSVWPGHRTRDTGSNSKCLELLQHVQLWETEECCKNHLSQMLDFVLESSVQSPHGVWFMFFSQMKPSDRCNPLVSLRVQGVVSEVSQKLTLCLISSKLQLSQSSAQAHWPVKQQSENLDTKWQHT